MAQNIPSNNVRTYKVVEVEYEPKSWLFGLIRWDEIVSKTMIGSHVIALIAPDSLLDHVTIMKGDKEYVVYLK